MLRGVCTPGHASLFFLFVLDLVNVAAEKRAYQTQPRRDYVDSSFRPEKALDAQIEENTGWLTTALPAGETHYLYLDLKGYADLSKYEIHSGDPDGNHVSASQKNCTKEEEEEEKGQKEERTKMRKRRRKRTHEKARVNERMNAVAWCITSEREKEKQHPSPSCSSSWGSCR